MLEFPPLHYLIEEKKKSGINVFEAVIGPEDAAYLLRKSKGNRSISQSDINVYAEDMRRGKFFAGNDAILISDEDVLLNYHHRSYAILESRCCVPCLVRINVNKEEAKFIDVGRKRTVVDTKAFDKTLDYIDRESVTIANTCLTGCSSFNDRDVKNRAVIDWVFKYKPEIDKVRGDFFNSREDKITQSVVLATFVLALINKKDENALRNAARYLLDPVTNSLTCGNSTMHKLRDSLLKDNFASDFGGGSGRKGTFKYTCFFINRYLEICADPTTKEIINKPNKVLVNKLDLFPCPDINKFKPTDTSLKFHIEEVARKLPSHEIISPSEIAKKIVENGYKPNQQSKDLERLVSKKFAKLVKDANQCLILSIGKFTPLFSENKKKRIDKYEFIRN